MGAVRLHRLFRRRTLARLAASPDGTLVSVVVDPEVESWGNCWLWSLARWLKYGGRLCVESSEFIPVWRAMWAPLGDAGPLYHFHPVHPKRGIRGIWAAFWHLGRPVDMRRRDGPDNR